MLEFFYKKIHVEPNTGCWLWVGAQAGYGYGVISVMGKNTYAHRYFYEATKGVILHGLEIDHLCRTRCCVNPDHLEAVAHKTNMHRSSAVRGAKLYAAGISECPKGHPYDEENTYTKNGKRHCRKCQRVRSAEYDQKNRIKRMIAARERRKAHVTNPQPEGKKK